MSRYPRFVTVDLSSKSVENQSNINGTGGTGETTVATAAAAACASAGIPPNICSKGISFINSLGQSGASTGDPQLDQQLCGNKPGILASGKKWKEYHDCLMNKGIEMRKKFEQEYQMQLEAQQQGGGSGSDSGKDGKPTVDDKFWGISTPAAYFVYGGLGAAALVGGFFLVKKLLKK